MAQWSRAWGDLEQAVRTGSNVEDPSLHLGTADFIRGMHDYAHYRGIEETWPITVDPDEAYTEFDSIEDIAALIQGKS